MLVVSFEKILEPLDASVVFPLGPWTTFSANHPEYFSLGRDLHCQVSQCRDHSGAEIANNYGLAQFELIMVSNSCKQIKQYPNSKLY